MAMSELSPSWKPILQGAGQKKILDVVRCGALNNLSHVGEQADRPAVCRF